MRATSFLASSARHITGVALQALLIAAIVAALAFATASMAGGAPGGAKSVLAANRSGASWITLAASGRAASTAPSLGASVAFDTGYPSSVRNPRIEVLCYQGGSLVYGEAGSVGETFLLGGGGSIWLTNGGSADCTANLFYFGSHAGVSTYNKLATTSFAAN
jgi:hypothetical protein